MSSEQGKGFKFDGGKPRMSLLPWDALEQVAWILTYGAEKYEPRSWQGVPNAVERYLDAAIRHLGQHADGEVLDPESKMPHLAHAAVNCLFVLHLIKDRIPRKYDLRGVREAWEEQRDEAKAAAAPPPTEAIPTASAVPLLEALRLAAAEAEQPRFSILPGPHPTEHVLPFRCRYHECGLEFETEAALYDHYTGAHLD